MKRTTIFFLIVIPLLISGILQIYIENIRIDNGVANIYQDNSLIKSIDLSEVNMGYEFDIVCESGSNTVHVEQGKICVSKSSCPDKICMKQGYISDGAVPIVCLPHKLIIKIESNDNNLDTKVK